MLANLVHETTETTGTGALTLSAITGLKPFSEITTDTFYYFISHRTADEYEVGEGSLNVSGELVRDTVIESSNADSLVSFSAGTKDVINNATAEMMMAGDQVQSLGTLGATQEIDVSNGAHIEATLGENVTLTFTGESQSNRVIPFSLRLNDADLYTITWPTGTLFPRGNPPIINGSESEIFCGISNEGTVTVYGVVDEIQVSA